MKKHLFQKELTMFIIQRLRKFELIKRLKLSSNIKCT